MRQIQNLIAQGNGRFKTGFTFYIELIDDLVRIGLGYNMY